MDWAIRPGRAEDTPAILDLFQATFGKQRSEAAYRWKFAGSPVRLGAPPTFVAEAEGRIVGHFGGTPIRFRFEGAEVPAVSGADWTIAEELRGHVLGAAILNAANASWAAGGAALQLALPTKGGFDGRPNRLGFRLVFRLGWLWRPPVPGFPGRRGVEVEPVEAPGPEFDALWEALGPRYEALTVRDRAWVTYRYAEAPFPYRILLARRDDRPAGYLVYREDTGWIADLFTAPEDRAARGALFRAARAAVRAFAAPRSPLWWDLLRAGFVPRRGSYDVRVAQLNGDLPWDVLRDPDRFFLTGGDFDAV